MRIALFGPPGVGKGSQAQLLHEKCGLAHISTGVILRQAIRAESEVGRRARSYVESGKLVPGYIVRDVADAAISENGFDNFVLDGYPRTIEQADWLSTFLSAHNAELDAVVSLCVPDADIVDRISKRRINILTGENYHLDFKPPPSDVDPSIIIQRDDDSQEAVLKRLRVYREETFPVEDYYRQKGKLVEVNGIGEFDDVRRRILEAVEGKVAEVRAG
jgi:adenylate kinase